jgi:hypothetical protein
MKNKVEGLIANNDDDDEVWRKLPSGNTNGTTHCAIEAGSSHTKGIWVRPWSQCMITCGLEQRF